MRESDIPQSNTVGISVYSSAENNTQTLVILYALAVNLLMFLLEFYYGLLSSSTSLLADSLDMLGDAAVYALTFLALTHSSHFKVMSAIVKAYMMGSFGLFIFCHAIYKIFNPALPDYETISVLGFLALSVNLSCFYLLAKYRNEDINMRSVWLCSRNDVIANILVIFAAILVWLSSKQWPDILIGLIIGTLLLQTSLEIRREAKLATTN